MDLEVRLILKLAPASRLRYHTSLTRGVQRSYTSTHQQICTDVHDMRKSCYVLPRALRKGCDPCSLSQCLCMSYPCPAYPTVNEGPRLRPIIPTVKDWDTPLPSTDRIKVLTIHGEWPREGTASSISGWVFTKLRISSGRALDALYCMPGAAQHPGLREDEESQEDARTSQ